MKIGQKGFTLIELLVALPIGTAILLVVVGTLFQIERGRVEIAGRSAAMMDIDNAVHWLTRDMVLAQNINLVDGSPPVPNLEMYWNDYTSWAGDEGVISHSANYSVSGTYLMRYYDGETTIIGRYITDVGFSLNGQLITISLTSQPSTPDTAITESFDMEMRSDLP